MARLLVVFTSFAVILGAFFGLSAAGYWLGSLADAHLFFGASRIVNLLLLMLVAVMVIATLLTLAERKWSAFMQDRIGPNRARIALPGLKDNSLGGIPHIGADVLKMLFKEDFTPDRANKFLFNLAPILAFAPVFCLFAVVPVGPTVLINGSPVDGVVATPDFGLLYLFAIASLAVYGISLAGWSSNNKFALLGGVRASSQMISYEVALGLSLVGMMMAFATVQLPVIVEGQTKYLWQFTQGFDLGLPAWGIILQPFGFLLFFAAAFAETKRAPFDVPEGESEIIGYFVEYSGMKFGLFMVSEFVEIVVLAGVITAMFFGGYQLPIGHYWLKDALAAYPILWAGLMGMVFWVKVLILCYLQLAIRWTFPRFRYDQIQSLGWKILLPLGLVNVFVTGALILWDPTLRWLAIVGLVELGILLSLTLSKKELADDHLGHGHEPGHHGHGHGHGDLGPGHGAPALSAAAPSLDAHAGARDTAAAHH